MADPVANERSTAADADNSNGPPDPAPDRPDSASPTPAATEGTDPAGGTSAGEGRGRRRGSRGGRGRSGSARSTDDRPAGEPTESADRNPSELPDRMTQGRVRDREAAERALVRRPQIGDTMPAPAGPPPDRAAGSGSTDAKRSESGAKSSSGGGGRRNRRGRGGRGGGGGSARDRSETADKRPSGPGSGGRGKSRGRSGSKGGGARHNAGVETVDAVVASAPVELDAEELEARRGKERKGRPVGRYLMAVSVGPKATQIAVFEGRNLIEHYVSRPSDDISQIHGNIYVGKVQNVLPGMEAAFVDIGTPKNAVLYRGDVQYDAEDIDEGGANPRIEHILKPKQLIVCQVTKNPIAHKGARLTQEVSLPGRFVVLIPNSSTYGISKRLPDNERKRLRSILDDVRPAGHGIIVRTAAENVTAEEIQRDVQSLAAQWRRIEEQAAKATKARRPALLYREPDMAVRVIREEFNADYRGVLIDDRALYEEVSDYVGAISPALADRVEFYDREQEPLSLYEHHHVHEQLHKALDPKVWLPSGGSLIIEHTEALTVIDVNTGKNVGSSSLEETVFRNNLEAAEEIARQLRLRDIGGIIVIDFIDMEIKANRAKVIEAFRAALARDKTRTQVFDISDLGLVEMTRKRIGEGLLESVSHTCPQCEGRGLLIDPALAGDDDEVAEAIRAEADGASPDVDPHGAGPVDVGSAGRPSNGPALDAEGRRRRRRRR
ncbi:MAG: Rne/Rng family ribonuclease [Acidimicrobiia bacterium]|nr:Rne/Rng family ribonuclease [Acidimicrobiia bacterium]